MPPPPEDRGDIPPPPDPGLPPPDDSARAAGTTVAVPEPEAFRSILEEAEEERPRGRQGKRPRAEMTFLDHLEELRMTIMKSVIAAVIGMALVGFFFVKFFNALRYPLVRALGEEQARDTLLSPLEPMGSVMMVINVSLFGGLVLALPFIAYFIVRFVLPGLTMREKGMLRPALVAALLLFALGALGCFFFLLPAGLKFSFEIDRLLGLKTLWSSRSYYSLVTWAVFGTGLVFEFPLILVILQVLGVIETNTLRRLRRHAFLVILIVGGLIAPSPDVISMFMMATPMYLLFEGSLLVGERLRKRRVEAEARGEQTTGNPGG